uniref:Uncharacterized protein n=1 Tax=Timema tahoe TaxID=61484 RepID=A0A7R9IQ80_9NEOP|nr:unnamed protein product [Timema tahoe]
MIGSVTQPRDYDSSQDLGAPVTPDGHWEMAPHNPNRDSRKNRSTSVLPTSTTNVRLAESQEKWVRSKRGDTKRMQEKRSQGDEDEVCRALKFEEEYLKALESFSRAQSLDPTWPPPQQKQAELLKYLDNVQDLVRSKGKLKVKKLQQMIQSLDVKQLGPYQGGRYTSAGSSISMTLVPITGLQPGTNSEKVVLGKVVCSVQDEDSVPL